MVSWWSYVKSFPAEKPVKLHTNKNESILHSDLISEHVPEAKGSYWYANKPLTGSGHIQTFLSGGEYEKEYPVWYGRRIFKTCDGGQVSIDYLTDISLKAPANWTEDVTYIPDPDTPPLPKRTRIFKPEEVKHLDDPLETRPLLIAIHGLTGGSHESYIRSVLCEVQNQLLYSNQDLQMAVLTSRGCNRTKITTPQLFNGVWTEDIRTLVNHVVKSQPNRSIFLTGFSLGASILTNYLGQEGSSIPKQVKAAIVVSNPWDMIMCYLEIQNGWVGSYVYIPAMAKNLCRVIRNNRAMLEQSPTFSNLDKKLKSIKTIHDFDNAFTGPAFGFDGADDYYRAASSANRLSSIRIPTLILHAEDDPICPMKCIPYIEGPKNPYVHIVTTTQGGHLGWFGKNGERWHSVVSAKYIRAFLTELDLEKQPTCEVAFKPRWFRDGKFQLKD